MKDTQKLLLIALVSLGMTSGSIYADTFDYSYTFGDGDSVSGTLEGTPDGNYVDNVQDVTVSINGLNSSDGPFADTSVTPVSVGNGETALTSYFATGGITVTITPPAVVSFDADLNNFVFGNSSTISGFMMLPNGQDVFNLFGYTGPLAVTALGGVNVDSEDSAQSSWSLVDVPDGGLSVSMLGLALAGLAGVGRKFRK
jgi:hypothetical protein